MNERQPERSVRLTFAYEGDHIRLLSQQPVEMIALPSDSTEPSESQSGFWYQLDDARGAPLYRHVAQHPIRYDQEVFFDDDEHTVRRVPVEQPSGVFTVVVPDIEEAERVSLHSSPIRTGFSPDATTAAVEFAEQPAQTLAAFKLTYK